MDYLDSAQDVFEAMTAEVRAVNTANGWHDDKRTFGEGIALLHSEVSEALEAFREHGLADATKAPPLRYINEDDVCVDYGPGEAPPMKPEGVGSEFADVLIRLLDESDRASVNLFAEYVRKIEYNKTRGYKHGGKAL